MEKTGFQFGMTIVKIDMGDFPCLQGDIREVITLYEVIAVVAARFDLYISAYWFGGG